MGELLTRRQRSRLRLLKGIDELPPAVAKVLHPLATDAPPALMGVLRAWRRLARVPGLSTTQHAMLRAGIVNSLKRVFHDMANQGQGKLPLFPPADFNVKNYDELADV